MSEHLEKAAGLAGAGDHEGAVECGREAAAAGLRAEGYEAMAASYEALGMHGKAAECLQKASREPSLRRGELLHLAGRHGKAGAEADRILKKSPGEPGAVALKARALASQNRHAEALEICGDAPDPRVLAAKGRALYETGDLAGAARCCARACSAPGFAARFYAALSSEGEEAQRYYAEAALQEPRDVDSPRARMGLVLWRLGRGAEALEKLDCEGDPKSACVRGQILRESGSEEADGWFKSAARCRSENWEDLYYVGLACHMLGLGGDASWHQKAARALKAAQARNRSGPAVAQLLAASEKERAGRLQEAEKNLRKPARKEPAKPEPKPRRRARPRKKEPRSLPPAPDPSEAIGEAKELCAPGSCDRALAALDGLPVPDRNRPDAQFWKAMAYYGLARYEEAHTCFENSGGGPETLYWRAASLFRLGLSGTLEVGFTQKAQRYRDAKRLLDRVLSADRSHPGALTLLALVEYNSARSIRNVGAADAERLFERALKADPDDAVALYYLGQARDEAGEPREANRMYDRAAGAKAGASGFDCWPSYCRGYSMDLRGQHETALSVYLDALNRDPDYGARFAEQMSAARGVAPAPHRNMQHPQDEKLDVCVVDTNVALPHLVRSMLDADVPSWMNLAYHRREFWRRLEEGSYVIPSVCRQEIMGQLNGGFLSKHAPGADRSRVTDGIRERLDGLPRSRWSGEAGETGPRDVMRIRRAYWRAWFGMSRESKEAWMRKKRRGNRRLAGGPPMGTRDTKILAVAAKLASGGSSVGLVTDDNDFLMFGAAIKELGVDVVEV